MSLSRWRRLQITFNSRQMSTALSSVGTTFWFMSLCGSYKEVALDQWDYSITCALSCGLGFSNTRRGFFIFILVLPSAIKPTDWPSCLKSSILFSAHAINNPVITWRCVKVVFISCYVKQKIQLKEKSFHILFGHFFSTILKCSTMIHSLFCSTIKVVRFKVTVAGKSVSLMFYVIWRRYLIY